MSPTIQLKFIDQLFKMSGLILHGFGSGGGLLYQRRILLRAFIHLGDGMINFFNTLTLLTTGSTDLAYDVGDTLYAGNNFTHSRTCLCGLLVALFYLLDRVIYQ